MKIEQNSHKRTKDSLNTKTLDFYGPFKFTRGEKYLFHSDKINNEGIYIWTIKDEYKGINYVHYVGETTLFGKRQREHLIQMTGLNYGIWDAELAKQGISKMIWNGMWRNKSSDAVALLLDNYADLSKNVKDYIGLINIYFAPTTFTTNLRRHIEGCIGWNLRRKYPEFKIFFPDDNHIGTKANRLGQKIFLNIPEDIAGIDKELII
ncbi:MAG: hypothetical protein K0B11_02925 [Mariniphaga sp.]|nr:hypothetical protein [Mariniphaga sp.]